MPLTKDQIAKTNDLKVETVPVPEWDGDVCIRIVMGWEWDKFEDSLSPNKDNSHARLAALVLCDPDGKPWYNVESPAYAQACHDLGRKSAAALDRIWSAALRLNRKRKLDIEELVKNSSSAPSGASGSNSAIDTPDPSASCSGN